MDNKELNTLMAELMGWKRQNLSVRTPPSPGMWAWVKDGTTMISELSWNPCENIEQAFMCVEKMRDNAHEFALFSEGLPAKGKRKWGCQIDGNHETYMVVESPALAICEAIAQVYEDK